MSRKPKEGMKVESENKRGGDLTTNFSPLIFILYLLASEALRNSFSLYPPSFSLILQANDFNDSRNRIGLQLKEIDSPLQDWQGWSENAGRHVFHGLAKYQSSVNIAQAQAQGMEWFAKSKSKLLLEGVGVSPYLHQIRGYYRQGTYR